MDTIVIAQWTVVAFGTWLIGVSLLMLARPHTALALIARAGSTRLINYGEITLRLVAGLGLVLAADDSSFPNAFRIFGWFVVATSGLLYFVPRKWHERYAVFCSRKLTPAGLRLAAPLSLVAGALLIHAVL